MQHITAEHFKTEWSCRKGALLKSVAMVGVPLALGLDGQSPGSGGP